MSKLWAWLIILSPFIIVILIFYYHAKLSAANAANQNATWSQVQDQSPTSDTAPDNSPSTSDTAPTPSPSVASPPYTTCNPNGIGGQICNSYSNGSFNTTYCNPNGIGGYNCY